MCAGALVQARLTRLVFGATDPKAGAVGIALQPDCRAAAQPPGRGDRGVLAEECGAALTDFFRAFGATGN